MPQGLLGRLGPAIWVARATPRLRARGCAWEEKGSCQQACENLWGGMESANQRPSHRRLGREADRNRPLSLLRERGLGESLLASAQHSEISGTAADAGATPGSTRRKVILEPPSSDRTFDLRRLALHQCTLRALTSSSSGRSQSRAGLRPPAKLQGDGT